MKMKLFPINADGTLPAWRLIGGTGRWVEIEKGHVGSLRYENIWFGYSSKK